MIVSVTRQIVFVAIPKTGTRSIYECLMESFDGLYISDHLKEVPKKYRNYFVFTVVRNPYSRTVSSWWSTCKRENDKRKYIQKYLKKENTFLNFCRHLEQINREINYPHIHPQAEWLTRNQFDKIVRFENLELEWLVLPFNTNKVPLPHINPTTKVQIGKFGPGNPVARDQFTSYLCDESVQIINDFYSEDFDLTGYKKL